MATITGTGVGSGLDVNNIVTSLMAVEKRPLGLLQAQASTLQTRITAFGQLQSQLASLADVATRLSDPAAWAPMLADSGDSSVFTGTATSAATAGQHAITVQQLAQAQVLTSGAVATSATNIGTGTLTLETGTTVAGVFTPKAGTSPVTITIGSSKQTLGGIRDAINAAGAGVTASLVNDANGARLVLRGNDGAASSIRLTAADADGNSTDTSGLSSLAWDPAAAAGNGANLSQVQPALDAKFTIDGLPVTSASNTATGALDGVTLTLRKVSATPVALSVSVQAMAVRKNVNDFVNAWNGMASLLAKSTKADPGGKSNGPLQSDSTAVGLLNTLRATLHGNVAGLAGIDSLNAAGITLQRDGTLAVDEKRFAPLLQTPDKLAALFTQTSATDAGKGIALRFKAWASAISGTGGSLASRMDGLQRSVTGNQKRQDAEEDRLARVEARIRSQYQTLDSKMSELNQRMAQMKSALGIG